MKELLFDGTAMQSTAAAKYHGGGEYAKFIFNELINQNREFDVVLDKGRETDPEIIKTLKSRLNGKIIEITRKEDIYRNCKKEEYKKFFTAHPYEYEDYSGSSQFIGVIHGIRPIELPWDKYKYKFYASPQKRLVAKILGSSKHFVQYWKSKHIKQYTKLLKIPDAKFITVSNHSKYSILNEFRFIRPSQLIVSYSPFNLLKGVRNEESGNTPYFLMISGNRYEKNVWRAALALDKLFSDGRLDNFKVIIMGAGDREIWKKLKNRDKFELKGYVSYEELGNLYANAFTYIYPSLNEGFGYPPLHAMGLGVPVIASSSTSIPEVCDNAASYFTPYSIGDLCSRILRITDDSAYREELIKRGKRRVSELLEMQEKSVCHLIDTIYNF